MSNQRNNSKKKLDILYDDQRSLLERLQIHQRNLNRMLSQKASYGLDIPLRIYNEIDNQETEINNIKKRLNEIDYEISETVGQGKSPYSGSNEAVQPMISISGTNYSIDAPYPFLRIETQMTTAAGLYSKWIYVGGIEVHATHKAPDKIHFAFFTHGQRVAPIIDHENKKLVIPLNYGVIVPSIILNTQSLVTEDDAIPEIVTNGMWTIVSPALPIHSLSVNEWPRGSDDIFHTTHVTYEGGYDLWIVQATEENKVTVWFYEQGWNVAPIINETKLTLAFPKQSQHHEPAGEKLSDTRQRFS